MLRHRRRRYCLVAVGASLLWVTLIAAILRLSFLHEGGRRAPRGLGRNLAIRTRQAVLPVRIGELDDLKTRPLEQWTDKQRTLLNM